MLQMLGFRYPECIHFVTKRLGYVTSFSMLSLPPDTGNHSYVFYEFPFCRFSVYVRPYSIYFDKPDLFYLAYEFLYCSSTLSQMASFSSFQSQIIFHFVYIPHLFIHSFPDRYLVCFLTFVIVNDSTVKIEVH